MAGKYLIFLPISELASIKDLDNSIFLSKNMKIPGILLKTNVSIKPKKIYFIHDKEIVRVFMFRQRLASKHYRLRDSKLAEWRSASGHRQKKKKTRVEH